MLKGYKKEEWKTSGKGSGITDVEQRRAIVIRGIEKWIKIIKGEELKGVTKLSRVKEGEREIRVKYHNHPVPLNDNGDYTGLLDIELDELTFWKVTIEEIKEGKWDSRINKAVNDIKKAFKKK